MITKGTSEGAPARAAEPPEAAARAAPAMSWKIAEPKASAVTAAASSGPEPAGSLAREKEEDDKDILRRERAGLLSREAAGSVRGSAKERGDGRRRKK